MGGYWLAVRAACGATADLMVMPVVHAINTAAINREFCL